ncbi:MAG: DUF2911 domain-containing protein [Flavobacteriales bacterium]
MYRISIPILLFASTTLNAQELPQPSPKGEVEQVVGLTKIEVEYSRPSVKGRSIFGDLVPYGSVWRTGANKCTTFENDGPVMIEGQELPAGKYSLFTMPTPDAWMIIFNRNTELWGEGDRKEEEDVLKVKVAPQAADFTETFTIEFQNVIGDVARLDLRWEKTRASVNIKTNSTDKALANIKEALAKPDADFRAYASSARFCVDRGVMTKEALAWAQKSVEMDKKFWNIHTLALAQAANGMTKEAISTAQMSMKLAEEAKNEAYMKMNRERIAEWSGKK